MYLMIENPNECPIECITLLGISTARGDKNKIGQFGTGFKHGINLLLRMGISPTIYSGNKRISFSTSPKNVGGKDFNIVSAVYDGQSRELFSLEFGALDWNNIDMAIREFVSNALDQAEQDVHKMVIQETVSVEGAYGKTRVFVPLTNEVKAAHQKLNEKFLHFTGRHKDSVIEREAVSRPKVYRKGVLVCDIEPSPYNKDANLPSLFDYNDAMGALKIDESRNMEQYSAANIIATIVKASELAMGKIFEKIKTGEKYYETNELNPGYFGFSNRHMKKTALDIWNKITNSAEIITEDILRVCNRKKIAAVVVPNNWYSFLTDIGVKPAEIMNDKLAQKGGKVLDKTTATARKIFNKVWNKMELFGLTQGKPQPDLRLFVKLMDNDSQLHGYYHNGTVFIEVSSQNLIKAYIEEIAHYITGANDETRDFQDFAFKACAMFMFPKMVAKV